MGIELREALLNSKEKAALGLIEKMDTRSALNDFIYAAAHSTDPQSIVLVDSVREALDYFEKNERLALLNYCASHLARTEKRDWDWPQPKYKRDALKAYLTAIRARRGDDARALAPEVVKHVGLNTLAETWLNLASEDPGANGATFVAASACRRSLFFIDESTRERLLDWATDFLTSRVPKSKVSAGTASDYEELANDAELMKRVCANAGEACANIVFLHRIKQNKNAMGHAHVLHLVRLLEKTVGGVVPSKTEPVKGATLDILGKALESGSLEAAIAAVAALAESEIDGVCKKILAFASKNKDPKTFIAAHAACEVSRTLVEPELPLVKAVSYLLSKS